MSDSISGLEKSKVLMFFKAFAIKKIIYPEYLIHEYAKYASGYSSPDLKNTIASR